VDSLKTMGLNRGEIDAYCYMVQKGKPAAMVSVHERYLKEAIALVTRLHGLKVYTENLTAEWAILWIYRYPHILEVIKSVPQVPDTVFDHWLLGKLFGYEEAAIQEFLTKHG